MSNKKLPQMEVQERREGDIVREQRHQIKIVGKNRPSDMRDAKQEIATTPNTFKRRVYLHLFRHRLLFQCNSWACERYNNPAVKDDDINGVHKC
jgi:hypothetical protein